MSDAIEAALTKKDLEAAFADLGPQKVEISPADHERSKRYDRVDVLVAKLGTDLLGLGLLDGDLVAAHEVREYLLLIAKRAKYGIGEISDAKLVGGVEKKPRAPRQPRTPKPAVEEPSAAEHSVAEHVEEEAKPAPTAQHFEPAPPEGDEPKNAGVIETPAEMDARLAHERAQRGAPTGRPAQQRSSATTAPRGDTDPNLGDGF